MQKRRPVMLVVLDGWGWREDAADNAIRQAKTPTFDRLWATGPRAFLRTSGRDVGLPPGQMGNSEVGHLNIGAGRVVMQDLPRIGDAIASGEIKKAPALIGLIEALKKSGGTCHLIGLVSPGGVHSHQDHAAALAKILTDAGVPALVHAITDGRDTPPQSAGDDLKRLVAALPASVPVATVVGRYYAMDRDKRWERVAKAYEAMVEAEGPRFADPQAAIADAYSKKQFDEFVVPAVIGSYRGMKDGDGVLCFNFRADRVREILGAMLDEDFSGFPRKRKLKFAAVVGMTQYSEHLEKLMQTIFAPQTFTNILGEVVAERKADPASHGGNRKVSARHLLPQRRPRGALRRRGPHHGALAQGRDLRPAAGNVRAGTDRQGGGGDQLRQIRPDRAELRQSRHGRSHRQPSGRDQGGGDGRHRARPDRRCNLKSRRRTAGHRRSRQLRIDARSRDRRSAHRAHHQSRCRSC